ncbi:MAG: arginase family protein [Planctomycetota bacterium]|jgi:arginase
MPYRGERNPPEISAAPASLDDAALRAALAEEGLDVAPSVAIELLPDEARQYGEWQRVALANRHLADAVARALDAGGFPAGLLANCNALPGMLAGLRRARGGGGGDGARTIGLVWLDAHADFNTPETTLSGMLGGMPVACAAGLCLQRLRETAGLEPPIDAAHILMAGLRDVDPLERGLLDAHGVREIPIESLAACDTDPPPSMQHLLDAADVIYVHVDMDVLDPREVPGHHTAVPGGPTSTDLAEGLQHLFRLPAVAALGIASTPPPELDPDGLARAAARRLIVAAARGDARGRSGSDL